MTWLESIRGVTAPENRTRKQHLSVMKGMEYDEAQKYWLKYCPKISRDSFEENMRNPEEPLKRVPVRGRATSIFDL